MSGTQWECCRGSASNRVMVYVLKYIQGSPKFDGGLFHVTGSQLLVILCLQVAELLCGSLYRRLQCQPIVCWRNTRRRTP